LIKKVGLTIDLIKNAYGMNTKWKWAFVDIEGRFATVTKNLFDLKNATQNMQTGTPGFETAVYHYRLICKLLDQAGDRYMQRYQLSTKRAEDILLAMACMGALKYIYSCLGDRENSEKAQKKFLSWQAMAGAASAKEKAAH
jgi:hypothetical protein